MIALNEIKKSTRYTHWTKKKHEAAIKFLSGFVSNKNVIINQNKIFGDKADYIVDDEKVIAPGLFHNYKIVDYKQFKLHFTDGFLIEFFGKDSLELFLPFKEYEVAPKSRGTEYNDQYTFVTDYLSVLVKERNIDDLVFNVLKKLITMIGICYDKKRDAFVFISSNSGKVSNGNYKYEVEKSLSLEDVLQAEVDQGYVNKDIGDPHRDYAYTHMLRQHAKFKLFEWSKTVLYNWKKYNVIAATRGQGKSYLAAFIVARELLSNKPGYGGRNYREIKYFVPNKEDVGGQVMDYIESILGSLVQKKLPNGKRAFEISKSKYYIKCNITGNIFKFISLYTITRSNSSDLGTASGEGIAADLAIVDEAARIPDSFWTSFHQRAAFETDSFYIISTINKETPVDHWFYRLLIDAENDDNKQGVRVTIDQNELIKQGKTDEEYISILHTLKKSLREGGDKEFYSKGYCIILEESNVFEVGPAMVHSNKEKFKDNDYRVLGFDLGKLDDDCAITLININKREIEESFKIKNLQYGDQLKLAAEYKKKYPNTIVIGDRSGVGEAVSEMDKDYIVDTWIKSTGSGDLSYHKKNSYYTCSKGKIINTLAILFHTGILKIPSYNVDLVEQLNNFVKKKSGRSETILYAAKGKNKDDLVLSCAYAAVEIYLILGLTTSKDWETYMSGEEESETYLHYDVTEVGTYHNGLY